MVSTLPPPDTPQLPGSPCRCCRDGASQSGLLGNCVDRIFSRPVAAGSEVLVLKGQIAGSGRIVGNPEVTPSPKPEALLGCAFPAPRVWVSEGK